MTPKNFFGNLFSDQKTDRLDRIERVFLVSAHSLNVRPFTRLTIWICHILADIVFTLATFTA